MENIRGEQDQDITDEQAQYLLNLRLNTSGNFSSQQCQEIIMHEALFLTATKESRDKHNVSMTQHQSNRQIILLPSAKQSQQNTTCKETTMIIVIKTEHHLQHFWLLVKEFN